MPAVTSEVARTGPGGRTGMMFLPDEVSGWTAGAVVPEAEEGARKPFPCPFALPFPLVLF